MVKFETLNTSIVILAEAHNPSILHPSFLSSLGIVPNDWQLAEPPICTPMVSIVKYANKTVFKAEPNKLMVLSESPTECSLLSEIVAKYVQTLPHVNYAAVGTNVAGYIELPDHPEAWIVERFLKQGPGNDDKLTPKAATIKLIYGLERSTLTLNCDPGSVRRHDQLSEQPCLLIGGNVHIPLSPEHRLEETLSAIGSHSGSVAKLMEMVHVLFQKSHVNP